MATLTLEMGPTLEANGMGGRQVLQVEELNQQARDQARITGFSLIVFCLLQPGNPYRNSIPFRSTSVVVCRPSVVTSDIVLPVELIILSSSGQFSTARCK